MSLSDPIADLLTRIRNAVQMKHRYVDIPASNMKKAIVTSLKDLGFVSDFLVREESNKQGTIRVFLKYDRNRTPAINGLKRVSRPGRRRYVGHTDIPKVLGGMGVALLSTSLGIVEGFEAKKRKLGGELVCFVW